MRIATAGLALRAFSSQTIASSVRDCSRCTTPIRCIPMCDDGIAGAEADGLLFERDRLSIDPVKNLHRPRWAYAITKLRLNAIAALVFGNGLFVSALRAQHLAFGEMRKRVDAGDAAKARPDQPFRAFDIGSSDVAVISSSTRPASDAAKRLCASTDRGSSANARSNRLIASARVSRVRLSYQRHVPGECSPARRDARLAGRPPRRPARG